MCEHSFRERLAGFSHRLTSNAGQRKALSRVLKIREYRADQLRFKRRFKKEKMDVHDKELRELEKLEKQEKKSNLDDN